MEYVLTNKGRENISGYILELWAKRKEIMDAGIDTCDCTNIPTTEEIFEDCIGWGFDEDGESWNVWGFTDNYDADYPVCLKFGVDVIIR